MISIIITVYNGRDYIEDTVHSALNQTVSKEIILVDDCSSDDSLLILKKLKNEYPEIKIIENKTNLGFCESVNIGLNAAKGEYVLVLGHDDLLVQDHCEKMLKYFDKDTSIVFCDYDFMDQHGQVYDTGDHCAHNDMTIENFYKRNAIPSVGLVMDRQKLIQVGGYPVRKEFPQYGEYHTWIRMVLIGKVIYCDEVRGKYRRHLSNITNTFDENKTQKKLSRYFNICKLQILKSPKVGISGKIYVFLHMHYSTLKVDAMCIYFVIKKFLKKLFL